MGQGSEIVSLEQKFRLFSEQWSPKVVAALNDLLVKIAKIEGEFVWHSHPDTDEFFLVHRGAFVMEYRDRAVSLKAGDIWCPAAWSTALWPLRNARSS